MIGRDARNRRAVAFASLKSGMYCDQVKKKLAFEGKCQFGKPSTLVMPAADNPLVTAGYQLHFDGMTFELREAVADFKPEHDREGFRKVAIEVFEAKWGPGRSEGGDRIVWPDKKGTMVLEYASDHWRIRDVVAQE